MPANPYSKALAQLIHQQAAGLPVIAAANDPRVLGWLTHRDVLRILAATPIPT